MKKRGLVHIYYGSGKGKTTAGLGQALRAWGWGKRIIIFQFLKKKDFPAGEIRATEKLGKNLEIIRFAQEHPMFNPCADKRKLKKAITESLELVRGIIEKENYDLVILDEILNAVDEGFVAESKVIDLIKDKSANTELILTGRSASPRLVALADYVSEIKEIKHPFRRGIKARRGIEY